MGLAYLFMSFVGFCWGICNVFVILYVIAYLVALSFR